ncbi:MAG TPA: hypothetical protein VHY81_09050 [Acidimicrobiales bacterium]|jgi:hypothetical protein|nr:hypothetical protein [Acidimicrobiales bacterium]
MKAHPLSVRLLLAAATAVLGVCALPAVSGAFTDAASADTPLPAGWELCILQGVGAPATQANVANLDEWQLAEGGSTNNSAAYNPFNTSRTTDVNNTPLPLTISANGFPAFTDWIAGCAATVSTILQPNMTPVAAALLAGNVSPPPAFLAIVDQSQWCAPSPDGTPCYADLIGGTTGDLAKAVLSASSALNVFGNVRTDLHSYQDSVTSDALAQFAVTTTTQQLTAAESMLASARTRAADAQTALRNFAVNEYVNSGLYEASPLVIGTNNGPFGTQSQNGVVAHHYATVVASDLLAQTHAATAAVKVALGQRNSIQKTLQLDETTLTSDNANVSHSLVRLVADVETLQKAGACTTAVITTPTPAAAQGAPGASGGSTPTPTPGPSAAPSTTTTTVAPPTTTTTSSTTTTTTTTTTTPGGVSLVKPLGTTTTTTLPPSTTTTDATTTTTTTLPSGSGSGSDSGAGAAPTPTANPGGLQVLQGCVTALAPSASA